MTVNGAKDPPRTFFTPAAATVCGHGVIRSQALGNLGDRVACTDSFLDPLSFQMPPSRETRMSRIREEYIRLDTSITREGSDWFPINHGKVKQVWPL